MDAKVLQELSELVQSSNLNFLLGAGVSRPFLSTLGDIEKALNAATSDKEKEKLYKKYLSEVMLPNKKIVNDDPSLNSDSNYQKTIEAYKNFFKTLEGLLLKRKSTILSKQVNVFTTNVDILVEKILESLSIEYNDGFSGKFMPTFGLANYKKSIQQRSLHFDHISEIPVFNLIKIHGSLTWKHDSSNEKIIFSRSLEHFDDSLSAKADKAFSDDYKKILVVNPEETKHLESVLNLYYSELLRMYSSELEKENAVLFVIGFSMDDKHIREITLRAAKSNPTLRVLIFCSDSSKAAMGTKMSITENANVHIHVPETAGEKFTLEILTETILKKLSIEKNSEKL